MKKKRTKKLGGGTIAIIFALAGIAGVFLMSRAKGSTGVELLPGMNGPLRYVGSAKLLSDALGSCWNNLYYYYYIDENGNGITPEPIEEYIIEPGTICYIEVLPGCTVQSFQWE